MREPISGAHPPAAPEKWRSGGEQRSVCIGTINLGVSCAPAPCSWNLLLTQRSRPLILMSPPAQPASSAASCPRCRQELTVRWLALRSESPRTAAGAGPARSLAASSFRLRWILRTGMGGSFAPANSSGSHRSAEPQSLPAVSTLGGGAVLDSVCCGNGRREERAGTFLSHCPRVQA
jgi:hypothetical protein